MNTTNDSPKRSRFLTTMLILAVLVVLILVVGWHLLFPFLGASIALGAAAWGFVVATITVLCIAILLFFMLTGVGIFIVGSLVVAWTVLTIFLFPILFPLLVPLLVILLFIAFLSRRKRQ